MWKHHSEETKIKSTFLKVRCEYFGDKLEDWGDDSGGVGHTDLQT